MKPIVILFFMLLCHVTLPVTARSEQSSLERLQARADDLGLYRERSWQVLLHYVEPHPGVYQSKIDDPVFFISPTGRTDAKAELAATLRSIFLAPEKDGEHVACRFPARFEWLKERLALETSELPAFSCTERDKALESVEAKSAVLVFPVGHINSPASMFGHTLIRIDGSSKSNLISYAANYSANTTDTNGFKYAWKGLTGRYKGYYSMMPYYLKVKEYNDLEHRDMWEYQLNLSPEQVRKMLNHIWELQKIHSSYYFLDENCSYNLLFLIEAANPELHLTEQTGIFVLPTQTVRIVMDSGLVEDVRYRPSQGTKIKKIVSLMRADDRSRAFDLALATARPESLNAGEIPDDRRKKILDLAAEYVQLRYARKELAKDVYSRLYLGILRERSRLGSEPGDDYRIEEPSRPESGHGTTMASLGGGVRRGDGFAELKVRPEFHGLLDPDDGYLRGAQIKFLDTALRYYPASEQLQLKTLHVLDILSISPRDKFFTPVSWKVNTGFDTQALRNGKDYLIYRLNTGGGFAYGSPFGGILYAFGEGDINAGEKIRAGVTIGPGLSIGDLEQITAWWKSHLFVRGLWYKLGDDRYTLQASVAQNFKLSRNNSLNLDYCEEYVRGHRVSEASLGWNYYF